MSDAWAFAARAWRRPGVEAAALALQDVHGQSPALLLWRLWTLEGGGGVDAETVASALKMARAWQAEVLDPLRGVRRRLKSAASWLEAIDAPGLGERSLALELDAERALLAALERLAGDRRGPGAEPLAALAALGNAWRPPPPMAELSHLVALLRPDAPAGATPERPWRL